MGKNNRYQYLSEPKTRKKLYKSKKLWLVAGITGLTAFTGGVYQMNQPTVEAHADTTSSQSAVANAYAQSSTPSQSTNSAPVTNQSSQTNNDSSVAAAYTQSSTAPVQSSAAPVESTAPESSVTNTSNAPFSSTATSDAPTTSVAPSSSVQTSTVPEQSSTTETAPQSSTTENTNPSVSSELSNRDGDDSTSEITNTPSSTTSNTDIQTSTTPSANVSVNNATTSTNATSTSDAPLTSTTSTNNSSTMESSFTTPNATVTSVNSATTSVQNSITNGHTDASNLASGANYALSSSNNSVVESAEIAAVYGGNNNDGNNGSSSSNTDNSNSVKPSTSATIAAIYNTPSLDANIREANTVMDRILNDANQISEPELRDAANAYLSDTAPALNTTNISINGYSNHSVDGDANANATGFSILKLESDLNINTSNNNSPYTTVAKPMYLEQAFQTDSNGNAPVQDPLLNSGAIQDLNINFSYTDSSGTQQNKTINVSALGKPISNYIINQGAANTSSGFGTTTVSTYNGSNGSYTDSNGVYHPGNGVVDSNGYQHINLQMQATSNPTLSNNVVYQDINLNAIINDYNALNASTPVPQTFGNGTKISATFSQYLNSSFTATSTNQSTSTTTSGAITNGTINSEMQMGTTGVSQFYQAVPIVVHYLNNANGQEFATKYLTANTNNSINPDSINKGTTSYLDNNKFNINIPSPTNWVFNNVSENTFPSGTYTAVVTYTDKNGNVTHYGSNDINAISTNGSNYTLSGSVTGLDSQYTSTSNDIYLNFTADAKIPVNPDNDSNYKPGTATNNQYPNGATFPNDTADTALTKYVTQTVTNYDKVTGQQIGAPTTQTLKFGRTVVIDQASGNVLGYTMNKDGSGPYVSGDQAWVLWDGNDNSTTGNTNAVNYADYSSQGYTTPSSYTDANGNVVNNATGVPTESYNASSPTNNNYKVYYDHQITTFTPDQAGQYGQDPNNYKSSATRTITYNDATTQQAINGVNPNTQTVTLTKDGVVDLVLAKANQPGAVLGYTNAANPSTTNYSTDISTIPWTAQGSFSSVTSPDLSSKGFTSPDKTSVGTETPTQPGTETVPVYYNHKLITFTPDQAKQYGQDVTNFQRTRNQVINYLDAKNNSVVVAPANNQTVTFTRDGVFDLAAQNQGQNGFLGYTSSTNPSTTSYDQGDNADWSSASYATIQSPDESAKGYKAPTPLVVNGQTVSVPSAANNGQTDTVNVYYPHDMTTTQSTPKNYTRVIHYVDAQDGSTLAPDVTQPIEETQTVYVDKVDGTKTYGPWISNGNHWTSVTSPDMSSKGYNAPDISTVDGVDDTNVPTSPNNITVKYTHQLLPSDVQTDTVNRTIHYVDATNGNTVAPDANEHVDFKRVGVIDQVLKDKGLNGLVGYASKGDNNPDISIKDADKAWIPTSETFNAIQSPDLSSKGYTAPSAGGQAEPVYPGQKDVVETVTYGHQSAFVGPDSGDVPGGVINPNDPNGAKWPNDVSKDNLQRDIVRTIHYIDQDTGKPVSADVIQDVTYKRMAVIDKVTGQLQGWSLNNTRKVDLKADDGDNAWETNDDQWAKAISPDLTGRGYNKQLQNVLEKSVKVTDSNATVTIPYTHDIAPDSDEMRDIIRTIHYQDGDTGATVSPDVVEKVQYYRTSMRDKVTGQIKGFSLNHDGKVDLSVNDADKAWQSNDNKWEGIDSPILNGYKRPDMYRVHHMDVAADQKDAQVTVLYYKKPVTKPAASSSATPKSSSATPSSLPASKAPASTPSSSAKSAASSATPTPKPTEKPQMPPYIPTPSATSSVASSVASSAASSASSAPSSSSDDQIELSDAPESEAPQTPQAPETPSETSQTPSSTTYAPTPVQQYVTPSYGTSQAPQTPQIATSAASNAPQQQPVQSQQAQLPQTGEGDSALEAELIGMLLLAFAELLRRMPHLMDKKNKDK